MQRIIDEIAADSAAHCLYDTNLLRRPGPAYCRCCGTILTTAYHEERLYSVACTTCRTVTLVKASDPGHAARKVGAPLQPREG
jgi:hypothetical protein